MRFPTLRFLLLALLHICFGITHALAQDNTAADSLKAELNAFESRKGNVATAPGDTIKVIILHKLVQNYINSDPAQALRYAIRQLALSENLRYQSGIANACVALGALCDLKSQYAQALKYYQRALAINRQIGNKMGEEDCYYNIGSLYGKQSNNNEALGHMLKGLAIATKMKDDFGMAGGYNNLGVLYKAVGNYPEALKAYFKCIDVMKRMKNLAFVATAYNNVGVIFLEQNKPEQAMAYNALGLQLAKKSGNKQAEGDNYHSIGAAHFKKHEYEEALDNYRQALTIRNEIEDGYGIAESHINIGNIHFKKANYRQAIAEIAKGLSLAKKSGEQDLMLDAYKSLSEVYAASENYKLAYKNHIRYKQMTDSLFNSEKDHKFVQLQMQYDFKAVRDSIKAVQDKKDMLARTAINDQKIMRNFIIIVMSIIVFFLIIVIWQRNKIAIVKRQKALETERTRISRDLHDNLGAQLSTVRMFISNIKNAIGSDASQTIDSSISLIDASIHDLRGIMEEMNSSILLERGYLEATEILVNKLNQLHTIHFSLTHHKMDRRADPHTEHQLYRITQELVNNTLKYANAKSITLDLVRRDGRLVFMYEDDGIGYDPKTIRMGYGLRNIETRVQSVKGTVTFDSTPQAGARTIIEIPW